ncbi:MAG: F0F1 ATP synthase subunit delta [Gammaproteobacteria bacterium]|nr:MAG: F0F1 ATP synthase subunit delta [Gammaproteobacteria bacterium]
MAGDATTIARPYAEAVFQRALETDKLDLWTEMLAFLGTAVEDPQLSRVLGSPQLTREQKAQLVLDIAGGRLSGEGENLVRLLAENGRLALLPEIASLYEARKAEHEGTVEVDVTTAYPLKPAQEQVLSEALKAKLGREVRIHSHEDPELIGGFRLRAGDMVIDGSVAGQLQQLAHELGL